MKKYKSKLILPGDKKSISNNDIDYIRPMLMVNHAGELGAVMIYRGQIDAILLKKDFSEYASIKKMLNHEVRHLNYFELALKKYNIRPTSMLFFWAIFGYIAGFISAIFGIKYAMILTESIEEVIVSHYQDQLEMLKGKVNFLKIRKAIASFLADEDEHRNNANDYNPIKSKRLKFASSIIKSFCKGAILISKNI